MTIEIHEPELEEMIRERMESGRFRDVEDILLQALKTSIEPSPESEEPKESLTAFLMKSPLRGSGLEVERVKDYPRPIEL